MTDGKIINNLQDLRRLEWAKIRRSSGTAGSFLKARESDHGKQIYYKLSDFDPVRGIVGHECINEIIADRLLTRLAIPHLAYTLVHGVVLIDNKEYETWLCRSEDFKKPEESKIALDTFYQLERNDGEKPLEFCLRMGWGEYISRMLLIDYLILNRDRHGANIEILRSREKKTIRPAPLFDHGLSLYFSAHQENEIKEAPLADKKIQSFVGSNSARDNLALIPKEYRMPLGTLTKNDREMLFEGLEDCFSRPYRDAVWNMIAARWKEYENICNS